MEIGYFLRIASEITESIDQKKNDYSALVPYP